MNPAECPCKKKKCERHGSCEACRAHHAASGRKVACERERRAVRKLFQKQ